MRLVKGRKLKLRLFPDRGEICKSSSSCGFSSAGGCVTLDRRRRRRVRHAGAGPDCVRLPLAGRGGGGGHLILERGELYGTLPFSAFALTLSLPPSLAFSSRRREDDRRRSRERSRTRRPRCSSRAEGKRRLGKVLRRPFRDRPREDAGGGCERLLRGGRRGGEADSKELLLPRRGRLRPRPGADRERLLRSPRISASPMTLT